MEQVIVLKQSHSILLLVSYTTTLILAQNNYTFLYDTIQFVYSLRYISITTKSMNGSSLLCQKLDKIVVILEQFLPDFEMKSLMNIVYQKYF